MMIRGLDKNTAQDVLDTCAYDEPVFVVRAQDILFGTTVRHWCNQYLDVCTDEVKAQRVRDILIDLDDPAITWRMANKHRLKIPS